jgi:hypothetical protein
MYTELFVFALADVLRENANDRATSYRHGKRARKRRKATSTTVTSTPRRRLRALPALPLGGPA